MIVYLWVPRIDEQVSAMIVAIARCRIKPVHAWNLVEALNAAERKLLRQFML